MFYDKNEQSLMLIISDNIKQQKRTETKCIVDVFYRE